MIAPGAPDVIVDCSTELGEWRLVITRQAADAYRAEVYQADRPLYIHTRPSLAEALAHSWAWLRHDHRSAAILLRALAEAELAP